MRVNESVRKTVFFIGVNDTTGKFMPYGSAFIGIWNEVGVNLSYLITAKHVLQQMQSTGLSPVARLNDMAGGTVIGNLTYEDFEIHPSIEKCDLTVACFIGSYTDYDIKGVDLNNGCLDKSYITENDIGAGSEVFTTGLLISHFGTTRNIPVVRTGNIAAMPEEAVDLGDKLGYQEAYLIESRSIGGLSGSPVFLNTPPARFVRGNGVFTIGHRTEYLIGVNIGLFETKAHGDGLPKQRADFREEFLETMSAGISIILPIERAIEIISGSPKFQKHHKDLAAELPPGKPA